jgi:hypothetical protein
MDWSPPPSRNSEEQNSARPQGSQAGWSFWATIPSWIILPNSRGSDHAVFYRVQVAVQSPKRVTTTRGVLKRFSDFLKLYSDLTKAFPRKKLPPAPPKKLLRMRDKTLLEERRCALEDWIEKILSDISLSRSADVATFLDLEAAARASFYDSIQTDLDPKIASDYDKSDTRAENCAELNLDNTSDQDFADPTEIPNLANSSDSEVSNFGSVEVPAEEAFRSTGLEVGSESVVAVLPSEERNKMNRVMVTLQRRLNTAKTDMEDLIARFNQEIAVRQYLTTKVKDLELDLESSKQSGKENLEQAILIERDRFTQTQWDIQELRQKCTELELNLKSEQDEKVQIESTKVAVIRENQMLIKDLETAKEQIGKLSKIQEEIENKSKSDIKLLVKEVKSLRNIQFELKEELSRIMKEKLVAEGALQKEKEILENGKAANAKLLHECEILRNRLEECSVKFLVEEENKLIVDNTSSASDSIDLLNTSDNRIGLLLAEAQLLAEDVEKGIIVNTSNKKTTDDELRKMVTDMFIENACARKQVNSALRCSLKFHENSKKDPGFDEKIGEEEHGSSKQSVLSRFLEK